MTFVGGNFHTHVLCTSNRLLNLWKGRLLLTSELFCHLVFDLWQFFDEKINKIYMILKCMHILSTLFSITIIVKLRNRKKSVKEK